jgi:hypothetical protein
MEEDARSHHFGLLHASVAAAGRDGPRSGCVGNLLAVRVQILLVCLLSFLGQWGLDAGEPWADALSRMPLDQQVTELNRTNCVEVMLRALQPDPVVKALVFMPGATDEFYMFRRARAELTNASPSLLDAVSALTNQTFIQVSFIPPLLLLHTDEDPLEMTNIVEHQATADRLRQAPFVPHVLYNDRDWDALQPALKKTLKVDIRPWRYSYDSWHFYRHSFAAWGLTGWEAMEAAALAGKSKFTVRRKQVVFEADPRVRSTPKLDSFPR